MLPQGVKFNSTTTFMIKLKFLFLLMFTSVFVNAQMSSYSYSSSVGIYTAISSGTDINTIEGDDMLSTNIPIGFSFNYCGSNYTKFRANSNGWISLDTLISPSVFDEKTNNLSGNTSMRPIIAPLWDDLDGTTGEASYKVTGSAPTRVLTIEWKNWEWNFQANGAVISFQIKLYETSNNIEFVYNPESVNVSSASASVGISDTSAGSGNFISLSSLANTATASATTETSSINVKPVSGQSFLFTRCNANIAILGSLCANFPAVSLNIGTGTPSGGTSSYFVNGNAQTTFDPSIIGNGNHTIMYVYSTSVCTDTNRQVIRVDSVTSIQFSMPASVCSNIDTLILTGAPIGGNYSGQGILTGTSNLIPTSLTNQGAKMITYAFTNAFNCSDSITRMYQLDTISKSSISVSNFICENTPAFNLTNGTPAGGSYFGVNVSNSVYSAGIAGLDTLFYAYQVSSGCIDTSFTAVTVNASPVVNFGNIGRYCANASPISLNSATPVGGSYSGPGVVGAIYTPNVAGTDTIKYVIASSNKCIDSSFQFVLVDSLTTTALSAIGTFCNNSSALTLSGGVPAGGTYSGNGVNGLNYSPSQAGSGFDTLYYSYTNGFVCKDSSFVVVTINSAPTVSYTSNLEFCEKDMEQSLNGAVPLSGVYKGLGVNSVSGKFDPKISGAGAHTITYVFTNGDNCSDSASVIANVFENPAFSLGADIEICGDESKELDPGIDSVSYIWNTGQTTRKITVKESKVFSITVTDTASGCASFDEVRVEYDAICVSIDEDLKETVSITYFPNPTNGALNVKLEGLQAQNVELIVFDMTGAQVFFTAIEINDLNQETSLDLSELETGNYLVRVITDSGSVVHRITKF